MADPTSVYLSVLVIGVVLTVVVGQILLRSGRPFLEDVFEQPQRVESVTRMLVVLFHLVVLGVVALVATIDVTFDSAVETVAARLAFILLVLGAAHAGTLLVLARLRRRRREQLLFDEMNAMAGDARRGGTQSDGQGHPDGQPRSGDGNTAVEPGGPGR
jgi:hypothetical protein